jgi:hypothetical protein
MKGEGIAGPEPARWKRLGSAERPLKIPGLQLVNVLFLNHHEFFHKMHATIRIGICFEKVNIRDQLIIIKVISS